ncbi:hypothetical protein D0T49_12400 [Paludibacter sp. 221]|uniref:hypothetical protein n=1 Tax=Paludibacter sp. 221 TaxID=2302939 RepID=UPI0013D36F73|nr:hypothetical protein [Paludibacter sp. 221]NDV47847.1 hypothetical protein [Paludibacter sp. 221]
MKKTLLILLLLLPSLFLSAQKKGYEKSIELGYAIGVGEYNNNTINLSMINGYRFSDYLYTGVGVGIGYSNAITYVNKNRYGTIDETRATALLVPIFAQIKANFTNGDISPFVSLNVGYTIDLNSYLKHAPGFMLQPNFGVDFKLNEKSSIYALVGFNLQHFDYVYTYNLGTSSSNWDVENRSEMFKAIDIKVGFKF